MGPQKGSPALPYRGIGLRLATHRQNVPHALTPLPSTDLCTTSDMLRVNSHISRFGFVWHSFSVMQEPPERMYPHLAEEFSDIARLVQRVEVHNNTIGFAHSLSLPLSPLCPFVSKDAFRVLGIAWFHLPDIKLWNRSLVAIVVSSLNLGANHENARKYE